MAGFIVACASCEDVFGTSDGAVLRRLWFTPRQFAYSWPELPAIHGNVLLIADTQGVIGFDRGSGALRWEARVFNGRMGGASSDVVKRDDVACVSDLFGGSGCADASSGAVLWTAPPDSSWSRQTAVDNVAFYYGTRDHRVVARDRATGSVRWSLDVAPGAPFITVVEGIVTRGDTIFAVTTRWVNENGFLRAGDLIAIDQSGKELWRFTPPGHSDFQAAPVFADNIVVQTDVDAHTLRGIDVNLRQQVWETMQGPDGYVTAERPPAIQGDTVFVGSTDTQIHAYSTRTGQLLWRVLGNAGSLGSTAICGRLVLVVPWGTGPLVALDRKTMRVTKPHVMIDDDELFSRIAVDGRHAYAVGMKGVYAFECAE
jgi:outer membrane protein assembly factor BamB